MEWGAPQVKIICYLLFLGVTTLAQLTTGFKGILVYVHEEQNFTNDA